MAFIVKPQWKITLFTLFFLPLLVYLGFWQLERASYKQQLLDQIRSHRHKDPVLIDKLLTDPMQTQAFQPVRITGSYDADYVFLLDNQIFQGRAGFLVLSLVKLQHPDTTNDYYALVNRGWIAQGPSRDTLPAIQLPENFHEVELVGEIDRPDKPPIVLKQIDEKFMPGKPTIIQSVDVQKIAKTLKFTIFPWMINLIPGEAGTFQVIEKQPNVSPAKHLGYAIQWFLMAGVLVIFYIYATLKPQ